MTLRARPKVDCCVPLEPLEASGRGRSEGVEAADPLDGLGAPRAGAGAGAAGGAAGGATGGAEGGASTPIAASFARRRLSSASLSCCCGSRVAASRLLRSSIARSFFTSARAKSRCPSSRRASSASLIARGTARVGERGATGPETLSV